MVPTPTEGRASKELSGVNQIQTVDVEGQATEDTERPRRSKRKTKTTKHKPSNSHGGTSTSRPSPREDDDDDPDLDNQIPEFTQKYTMSRRLSPYWSTTRGILTIIGIILLIIGAIVGGAVGGLVGNRDAKATPSIAPISRPSSSLAPSPSPTEVQARRRQLLGAEDSVAPRSAETPSAFAIRGSAIPPTLCSD